MLTIPKSLRFATYLPLLALSFTVNAQVFTVTNDTVAVDDGTGFSVNAVISSTGLVSTVNDIPNPVAGDALNIPSFTFDLDGGGTRAAGVYTFTAHLRHANDIGIKALDNGFELMQAHSDTVGVK